MRRLGARGPICAALLIGLLAASSPRAGALEIKRLTLANGAILLVSPQHKLPMVTAAIAFDAGSRRDPKGKEGLADLTANSIAEGTKTLRADELNQKIDFLGSEMDVSAGRDYSGAGFTSLKRYWRDTLKLMAGVLTDPGLRDDDIARKQAEQLAALKAQEEEPGYVADVTYTKLLFGDTPYGHLAEGTVESVGRLTPQDVKNFYHDFYKPQGAIISVVGDIEPDEVAKAFNEQLGPLKGGVAAQKPQPLPPIPPGSHVKTIDRDVTQANIVIGFDGVARSNPDYYRLQVMNYILGGGGFASRLVKEVRSKAGLVYSIHSGYEAGLFPGSFQVVLETKNKSANEAIRMVLEQMRLIQQALVSDAELESAKKHLIGSFPLKLDTQSSTAQFLLQMQLYGLGMDYIDRYPSYIRSVTKEDVQKVAKQYLHPDSFILVAVANQSQAEINVASTKP